jgi:hypothetical protein
LVGEEIPVLVVPIKAIIDPFVVNAQLVEKPLHTVFEV